ncbi:alpha/beta hydrolase [Variovorax sp. RB2P76]|uniref:alpha/beta hydrolase n=1 Tax=Variovorax sp. RB2P76 TaxID=3443736 RepID=UPI003F46AB2A
MRLEIVKWIGAVLCIVTTGAASAQKAWREEVMETPGPQGPLQGTLLSPVDGSASTATVLIVPGSGPTDRQGNGPQGLQSATYRLLAQDLATRGISSLRIDKRGLFGSAAAVSDANNVKVQDYAHDVTQWVTALRQRTAGACVWVLGHSEGGVVALMADQSNTGLCGLILVATPGRPLGEVLRTQLKANPANSPLIAQAFGAIDSLEAGRRVDMANLHPALQPLFRPAVQDFLIDSFAIDPARLAATAHGPILILQGARDLQVGVEDARRLQAAAPDAKLVVLPDVNHVLKAVPSDDRAANIATYSRADLALPSAVVDTIADFVSQVPAH